jgi:hypothetical protein
MRSCSSPRAIGDEALKMKMKMKTMAALLLSASIALCGEDAKDAKELLGFYDTELIKVNYQTMGGLALSYKGQSTATMMGISGEFQRILGEYEDSGRLMRSYRTKNLAGNILMFGGAAASLCAAYYPLLANDSINDWSYSDFRASIYISIGGLIASLVGSFILPSGYQDLFNSVNSYNRNKLAEF